MSNRTCVVFYAVLSSGVEMDISSPSSHEPSFKIMFRRQLTWNHRDPHRSASCMMKFPSCYTSCIRGSIDGIVVHTRVGMSMRSFWTHHGRPSAACRTMRPLRHKLLTQSCQSINAPHLLFTCASITATPLAPLCGALCSKDSLLVHIVSALT